MSILRQPVLPVSLDVVRRRLSRLSPETNDVMRAAAVVGREFDAALVTELVDLDADGVVDALDEALPNDAFASKIDRRKAVRQTARAALPNATETKIFATGNVRAWRHFIEMRAAIFADWEIRILAIEVLKRLQEEAPLLFGDFTIEQLPDGTEIATPAYSKV